MQQKCSFEADQKEFAKVCENFKVPHIALEVYGRYCLNRYAGEPDLAQKMVIQNHYRYRDQRYAARNSADVLPEAIQVEKTHWKFCQVFQAWQWTHISSSVCRKPRGWKDEDYEMNFVGYVGIDSPSWWGLYLPISNRSWREEVWRERLGNEIKAQILAKKAWANLSRKNV